MARAGPPHHAHCEDRNAKRGWYDSMGALQACEGAMSRQDAVVSATATEVVAFTGQNALVDAAVATGVKCLIPSEFRHNLKRFERFADGKMLRQMLDSKARTARYVKEKAEGEPWLYEHGSWD